MSQKEVISVLQLYFPNVSKDSLLLFYSLCTYQKVKNRCMVLHSQPNKRLFFFILKGVVRGFHTLQNGEEKNIFIKPEGTFVGPPDMLFTYQTSVYSFESILESEVLIFDLRELENRTVENHELMQLYFSGLKENILTLIGRVESLTEKSPEQRYLDLIEKYPIFFKKAFNKHIASYLGITPVSLSRIIKRVRDNSVKSKPNS